MILEQLPDVLALSTEEKTVLAQELLDELNAPVLTPEEDSGILELLNARFEAFRSDPASASTWKESRERLQERTGASWRKS